MAFLPHADWDGHRAQGFTCQLPRDESSADGFGIDLDCIRSNIETFYRPSSVSLDFLRPCSLQEIIAEHYQGIAAPLIAFQSEAGAQPDADGFWTDAYTG